MVRERKGGSCSRERKKRHPALCYLPDAIRGGAIKIRKECKSEACNMDTHAGCQRTRPAGTQICIWGASSLNSFRRGSVQEYVVMPNLKLNKEQL